MQKVLSQLAGGDLSFMGKGAGFDEFKSLVDFEAWADIENRYR
jgi:hypothetical protein